MSVWPNSSLSTSEGELLSVSIAVAPRRLEALLEALAQAGFPINPRIRHGSVTTVEFPAYEGGLTAVRGIVGAYGFDPNAVESTRMLEQIHAARTGGASR